MFSPRARQLRRFVERVGFRRPTITIRAYGRCLPPLPKDWEKNHRQGDRQRAHSPSLYARSMNKDKKSGWGAIFLA
jgi:hypothetical protein